MPARKQNRATLIRDTRHIRRCRIEQSAPENVRGFIRRMFFSLNRGAVLPQPGNLLQLRVLRFPGYGHRTVASPFHQASNRCRIRVARLNSRPARLSLS
jgi:hypothetical protein